MYSFRHGAHAFRVSGLDLEVVGGVQCQLLDLVSQSVAHHWFNNPVVDLGVYICAVVDDIAYDGVREEVGKREMIQTLVLLMLCNLRLVRSIEFTVHTSLSNFV